jgi:hypothetical protein
MWITNRHKNPNLELRNADDYYVPPHNFATTKRFPFYTPPRNWNEADQIKYNPSLKVHKNEIIFGFDFEICIISLLVMSKY